MTSLPLARAIRLRRGRLPILGWALFAVGSALIAKSADHALRGAFGFVVLPLLSYGIVSAVLSGGGLKDSIRGLVAIGAEPRKAALSTVLGAIGMSALLNGLLAMVVAAIAHRAYDVPLVQDLPSSFLVAAAGGATYAAYFCAGSAIGRGAARGVLLAADWLIGAPGGFGALFTPRGHLTSLLGGSLCFDLSRKTSSIALVILLLGYTAVAVLMTPSKRTRA